MEQVKTAIFMGCGPSLNRMPLALTEQYDTFGANYITIQPKFYICIDGDTLKYRPESIMERAKAADIAFLSGLKRMEKRAKDLYALPNVQLVNKDMKDFKNELWMSGLNSAYVGLKLAYYMGYDEVWMWGVDHDDNWSHYRPDYPESPYQSVYLLERMRVMENHFQYAAAVYKKAGKRIINFSNPSALDQIFRRG